MKLIGLVIALATFTSGCTYGELVDGGFGPLGHGGSLSFHYVGGGDPSIPPGWSVTSNNVGSEYISFDAYAPNGATNANFPGVSNVSQVILPGEYYVQFQQTAGSLYYTSNNFMHAFDPGSCTDGMTGGIDQACEAYLFQVSEVFANQCDGTCAGAGCPVVPLTTHSNIKVIQLCDAFTVKLQ